MSEESNDMIIQTNANVVSLKNGTSVNTLFKLSNTVTSIGQGSHSTGLNAISIGSNGESVDSVPIDQSIGEVDGKLTIHTIRRSGTGGNAPTSNYVMMYNPDLSPNEATYSSDIPDQVTLLTTNLNTETAKVATLEAEILDLSGNLNTETGKVATLETQVADLLTRVSLLEALL